MALATFKDLCLDAADAERLGTFWAGALGLELRAAGEDSNGDVLLVGPTPQHTVWVNQVPEPKTAKHRMHLDVNVGSVDELTRLGATVVDADTFRWTLLADPEGGELCAFVREGEIEQRLYEIVVASGDSAQACHRIASWWAEVLGARLVDDDGYSYVEDVPGAPYELDRLRAGAGAEDREEPGPPRRADPGRRRPRRGRRDRAAAPGRRDPLDGAGRPGRQRVLRVRVRRLTPRTSRPSP